MAQVLKDSIVGYPDSLAIFDKPIQNIGIRQVRCVNYYPVNDFTTQGVIQFSVPGTGNAYMDLSKTCLNIRCKIVKKDNTPLVSWSKQLEEAALRKLLEPRVLADPGSADSAAEEAATKTPGDQPAKTETPQDTPPSGGEKTETPPTNELTGFVGIVNNSLHSMFSRVDVTLQNKLLTESDTSYPYQSYVKALLYTSREMKNGTMQMQLYYHDDVKGMDDKNWIMTQNRGLKTRSRFFDGSQEVELSGSLYCDLFEINKLIPNGVSLNITLYPSIPEFSLMVPDDDAYKLIITKATLSVCKTDVSPEIIAAHSELMVSEPAIYCYSKSEIKKVTLPNGVYNAEINDPFTGRVPSELVIALVESHAAHGSFKKNPFFFAHHKVSRVQVTADGSDLGHGPIETNYEKNAADSLYVEAYKTLKGVNGVDDEIPVSRLDYPQGYCFYRFVSDHIDRESSDDLLPLRRTGNLRVSIRFDEMLQDTTTVVLFARFPAGIKIDKNRAVHSL